MPRKAKVQEPLTEETIPTEEPVMENAPAGTPEQEPAGEQDTPVDPDETPTQQDAPADPDNTPKLEDSYVGSDDAPKTEEPDASDDILEPETPDEQKVIEPKKTKEKPAPTSKKETKQPTKSPAPSTILTLNVDDEVETPQSRVNNPGRNPSPVRRMEITNPFVGNHISVKKEITLSTKTL